ncbi:MAG: porin [Sutterellaceae bacterium]|nr:porin [Sutterellaceae bacterium]
MTNPKVALAATLIAASASPLCFAQPTFEAYGTLVTGLYYTDAQGGKSGKLGMSGWKETPLDSKVALKGREDLGNGWYAGFQLESGIALDTGAFGSSGTGFNAVSRIFVGTENIEFTAGRMPNFTAATSPYSFYARLRANATRSQLAGLAPAGITFNLASIDNLIAFSTPFRKGFFIEGLYSNGAEANEQAYDWEDRDRVVQLGTGWVGDKVRFGINLSYATQADDPRYTEKNATKGIHLVGNYNFGGPEVALVLYKGFDDWQIGAVPDMGAIVNKAGGTGNYNKSAGGMDTSVAFLSFGYPYQSHYISFVASYLNAKWKGKSAGMKHTEGSAWTGGVLYYYYFTKKTQLYAGGSYSAGDKLLNTVDRFNQVMLTTGLLHKF